jgi:hypothetical protein
MIKPCRKACPFFFAGVSAAKKKEIPQGGTLRLCGEEVVFKRRDNYELKH